MILVRSIKSDSKPGPAEESNAAPKQLEGPIPAPDYRSSLQDPNILITEMQVDQDASKSTSKPKSSGKGRIEKRRSSRKASIVFPKFKNGKRVGQSKGKK
jgi:hypothetical protein